MKDPLAVASAKSPRTPLCQSGEGAQGFSYIEVLAALLIFTLGLFVVFGTITQLTKAAHSDKVKLKADLWARVLLDQVRAASSEPNFYEDGFLARFPQTIQDEGSFPGLTATRNISAVNTTGQRQVTVTITGRASTKSWVYTMMVGRNASDPGGVTIKVQVVEASRDGATFDPVRPVIAAMVEAPRADLPGAQMFETTDTNGFALLRGVARSTVTITVYKAGVDPADPIQRIPLMSSASARGQAQGYGWLNGQPNNQAVKNTADVSEFPPGEIKTITIPLIPKGHVYGMVRGRVRETENAPISSATVRLYMNGPPYGVVDSTVPVSTVTPLPPENERYFFEVKTDAAGVYVFNNVWPGRHRIWLRGKRGSHPTIPPSDGAFMQGYVRSFLQLPSTGTFINVDPYNYQAGGRGTDIPTRREQQLSDPTTYWNTEQLGGLRVFLKEAPLPPSPSADNLWIPKPTGGTPSFPSGPPPTLTVFGISDPELLTPPVERLPSDYLRDFPIQPTQPPRGPNKPWWVDQLRRDARELSAYKGIQYSIPLPVTVSDRLRPRNPYEDFYNLFGVSMDKDNPPPTGQTGIQYDHFQYSPRDHNMRWLPLELREANACAPAIPEYIPSSVYFPDVPFHHMYRPNSALPGYTPVPGYTPITVYKNKSPGQQVVMIPLAKYSVWGSSITGVVVSSGGAPVPIPNALVQVQGCTIETDSILWISTRTAANGTFTLRDALPSFTTPFFRSSPSSSDTDPTDCWVDGFLVAPSSRTTDCSNANFRRLWVSGEGTTRSVSVFGQVTDRERPEVGVEGATVTVQGASDAVSAITNYTGDYNIPSVLVASGASERQFEGLNIAPHGATMVSSTTALPSQIVLQSTSSRSGNASLNAQHPNYAPSVATVDIDISSTSYTWSPSLTRYRVTVTGVVTRQQDRQPLRDKKIVTAYNPDGDPTTTTDSNGNFTLSNVVVTAQGDGLYYVTLQSPYGLGSSLAPDGTWSEGRYEPGEATSSGFPAPSYTTTVQGVNFQLKQAEGL